MGSRLGTPSRSSQRIDPLQTDFSGAGSGKQEVPRAAIPRFEKRVFLKYLLQIALCTDAGGGRGFLRGKGVTMLRHRSMDKWIRIAFRNKPLDLEHPP